MLQEMKMSDRSRAIIEGQSERRAGWNRGDICAYRVQLKGWYPDGEIRERRGKRGHWKMEKEHWESERGAENRYRAEGEDSSSCRFSDEEIAVGGKAFVCRADRRGKYGYLFLLMHCQRLTPVLCILIPASWEIPSWSQEKERKVGTGGGNARSPGVSRCHRILDKEIEVKQMKWPTEWNPLSMQNLLLISTHAVFG